MTSRAGEAAAATKQGNTTTSSPGTFFHLFRVSFQGQILGGKSNRDPLLNVGPVGSVGAVRTCRVCLLSVVGLKQHRETHRLIPSHHTSTKKKITISSFFFFLGVFQGFFSHFSIFQKKGNFDSFTLFRLASYSSPFRLLPFVSLLFHPGKCSS